MKIDITSLCFGFKIEKENDSGTAAWATSIGQAPKGICYIDTNREGLDEIVYGMMYKSHSDFENLKVRDVEGLDKREEPRGDRERMMFSVFDNVYVNNKKVKGIYTLSYEREDSSNHKNRLHICYAKYLTYNGHSNKETLNEMAKVLGCNEDACWFVTDISIKKQSDLYFTAIVVNPAKRVIYADSKARKQAWETLVPEIDNNLYDNNYLQQIFYGAPGTGKSHTINNITEAQPKGNVFRTTFHPDSDYSTFVGAYKPTKLKSSGTAIQPILDYDSLVDKFKEYLSVPNANITKVCTQFGFDYHDSIVRIQEQGRKVMDLVNDAYKSNTSYDSVVRGGMACYEQVSNMNKGTSITYEFVPQSFTKAYVRAWQTDEPVYLVIEEINRGNCAQIFGDLFQLLDRKDGFSEYPIKADNDLAQYLSEQFFNNSREDIPENVKSGEELVLPNNLYIWATMNTSDQSLFPIDSAFKRRWDWKYVPISNTGKDWRIEVNNKRYDWWDFLEKINKKIEEATNSEDKKLGYFFCKATNGIINAETFVGKVIFYIWNDVFKDFAEEAGGLFKGDNDSTLSFNEFYTVEGAGNAVVNEAKVALFLQNLGVEPIINDNEEVLSEENDNLDRFDNPDTMKSIDSRSSRFKLNGEEFNSLGEIAKNVVLNYAKNNPSLTSQNIRDYFSNLCKGIGVAHIVETEDEYHQRDGQDSQIRTVSEITIPYKNEKLYISTQWRAKNKDDNFMKFMDIVNSNDLGKISQ